MRCNFKRIWEEVRRKRHANKAKMHHFEQPPVLSIEDTFLDNREEEEVPTVVQTQLLPEGWAWENWSDGSGCLLSPDRATYFQYDIAPYAPDGLEFRENALCAWVPFWGSLADFCLFAEKQCLQQILPK